MSSRKTFQSNTHNVRNTRSTVEIKQSRHYSSGKYQPKRQEDYIWERYRKISLGEKAKAEIKVYYQENVVVNSASRDKTKNNCNPIVHDLLHMVGRNGLTATEPDTEGSLLTGVKTGKADECDYSVEISLLEANAVHLSNDPFKFVFEDDIDSSFEKPSGTFASNGKRFFPNDKKRKRSFTGSPEPIKIGYTALCLGDRDAKVFLKFCTHHQKKRERTWLIPFLLLSEFYTEMEYCIKECQRTRKYNVKIHLNEAGRGPAITLTIEEEDSHNISVDITPKISLPSSVLSLRNFGWPRRKTKQWLKKSVIKDVLQQQLYLVPKGDKYWKISFANCENALLAVIDAEGTWRKGCLRLMKKKLSLWRSKSNTGLKGISSYHLKVTLLWLCENLPDDDLWKEDQLANRYLTFLKVLNYRLKIGRISEYFHPEVNLLQGKDQEEIEEVIGFIEDDISGLKSTTASETE